MRTPLAAAGLRRGGEPAGPGAAAAAADRRGAGAADSARLAAARSGATERVRRQRQQMRPLAWAFIAAVVISAEQGRAAPGLAGARLGVTAALAVCAVAAAVGLNPRWAGGGRAAQAVVIVLLGGGGVALAALQPHGATGLAASLAVWVAAVRRPAWPAAAAVGAVAAALATAVALTRRPAAAPAVAVTLFCLLLAVTGRFIRRSRESQDQTELLMAQLQDARDAEAAAAALAERGRIGGELHDVLAHALPGLAIQLQGARKLAAAEGATAGQRASELAREGLTQARQAAGALRGDRLPSVTQLPELVDGFRRDTGTDVSVAIEGDPRPLPAEAGLALYRSAREALTNIARYAPGAVAAVTIGCPPGRAVLTVQNSASPPRQDAATAADPGPGLLAAAGGGRVAWPRCANAPSGPAAPPAAAPTTAAG